MRPSNTGYSIVTGANSVSSALWATDIIRTSVQITIGSGDVVGTFRIQGSNDLASGKYPHLFTPTNWFTVGSAQTIVCSNSTSGSGIFVVPSFETSYEYLRIQFTDGSGAAAVGVVNVRFAAKGL